MRQGNDTNWLGTYFNFRQPPNITDKERNGFQFNIEEQLQR